MLFFADSAERALVQGLMIGLVAAVATATLLVIGVLNNPFRSGFGGLRPIAMERTLWLLDQGREVVQRTGPLPCDASGVPRTR
jgi:hypothetical protein